MKRIGLLATILLLALAGPAFAAPAGPARGGNGWGVIAVTVITLLAALPFAILVRASLSWPERIADAVAERPWRTLLLGLVNLLLVAVIVNAVVVPVIQVVAALIGLAALAGCFLGLLGVATGLGRKLRGGGIGSFVLAWLVISGLPLLPWVGHVALLWLAAQGLGGVLLTLGRKRVSE